MVQIWICVETKDVPPSRGKDIVFQICCNSIGKTEKGLESELGVMVGKGPC
jgi:hypothetical protein